MSSSAENPGTNRQRTASTAARLLRSIFSVLGQAWMILGITLVLLLLVDQALRALLPEPGRIAALEPGVIAPGRSRADAVGGDAWIDAYWNEHQASRHTQWASYVYWRRKPFDGDIIDVDAHGFRVTPAPPSPAARTIWLFGGSTAWGTGNRNQGTLAAQLQQIYRERAPQLGVRVLNFAESGYVSRQSLIAFQSALACPQPAADVAIFLDGANDVFAALQEGQAGLPQNEDNRRREFNSSRQLAAQLRAWALRLEGIARLVGTAPAPLQAAELDALALAVVDAYLTQVGQAAALAREYRLDAIHAWQPTAFDRAPPRADEAAIVGASMATHVNLHRQVRARLRERLAADPSVAAIDLGSLFDSGDQPVYFDFVHLSERGQRLLAERLYELSAPGLTLRPARPATVESCRDRPLG
jgi:lysophospholipase L1-like esterase